MPEGPEVRSIADALVWMEGKKIVKISSMFVVPGLKSEMLPLMIKKVWCHGKRIIITCDKGVHFFIFLAMTGVWLLEQTKHTRMLVEMEDESKNKGGGYKVYFDDLRHMGKVEVLSDADVSKKIISVGPDILQLTSWKQLYNHVVRRAGPYQRLCDMLLDQELFNGVGNYLRSEILYYARAYPFMLWINTPEQIRVDLIYGAWFLTHESYKVKGLSISDYRLPDGSKGMYKPMIYNQKITSTTGNPVTYLKDGDGKAARGLYVDTATQKHP